MRLLVLIFMLLPLSIVCGQSVGPDILTASGEQYVQPQLSLQWTLGEMGIQSYQSNSIVLSEGFNQSFSSDRSTSISTFKLTAPVTLFPSPVTNELEIIVGAAERIKYEVVDVTGRQLLQGQFKAFTRLTVSTLDDGPYFLLLTTQAKERGVYAFVKTH